MPRRVQQELPVIAQARAAANIAQNTIRAIERAKCQPWQVLQLVNEHFAPRLATQAAPLETKAAE